MTDDTQPSEVSVSDSDRDDLERLLAEFDALAETVDSPRERERVRSARRAAVVAASEAPVFGRVIRGFDRTDLAEAFLGCVLFGIPMFVEGGTNEVGHFLATHPISLVGTLLGATGLVVSILYVADIQDVRVQDPFFGVVPRRLVGVLGVSLLTAAVVMTGWGRVEWGEPLFALGDVVVAFVPMSIGAALGDILPGT
ncbi:DUF2391 family protein [Halobellus rufus]|uniref:DUF2391 family protein n=1 Tax=Halobellus rufus TaxID=1448860 RepID=UPI0006796FBC|nr:DUF2391 family protein [Halobellus rufus]